MKKTLAALILASLIAQPVYAEETAAKQAFLIDAATHSVLLNKAGDEKMHPSSMSKLMTLYVLFSRLKEGRLHLTDKLPISEKAWRTQGSKTFVKVGEEIAIEDLIHGIIIQSGNDACIVVAEGISGSEEAFAAELNRVAKEIGLEHSHFVNATGLPEEEHVMSARDLATLAERLLADFPEYYAYFGLREYTYNNITQHNRNRLLGGTIGVDGLKTGHTEAAGYGITLSAKQGERRLILVINGLESDDARVQEGDRLLRWGFREFENKTVAQKGAAIAEADVWFGKQKTVKLVADKDLLLTLPVAGQANTTFTLKYTGPLPAPIKEGDKVAELIVTLPTGDTQSVPLYAGETVEKLSGFGRIMPLLDHYIFNRK